METDPFLQFSLWFDEAKKQCSEPEAMALATASTKAIPSLRMVLLKKFDARGFLFFTNSESRKGKELEENPQAALTFYWKELDRQITAEGAVIQAKAEEADAYFSTRPRLSQLGAWASHQDKVIPSREALLEKLRLMKEQFEGKQIPRPTYWNGYWLIPKRIEFWQGQEGRLHDRFLYELQQEKWVIKRLSP